MKSQSEILKQVTTAEQIICSASITATSATLLPEKTCTIFPPKLYRRVKNIAKSRQPKKNSADHVVKLNAKLFVHEEKERHSLQLTRQKDSNVHLFCLFVLGFHGQGYSSRYLSVHRNRTS